MALKATLPRARMFDALGDREVEALASLGEERTFDTNEAVFQEYESADSLYVLIEGRVNTIYREQGMPRELAQHGPGDHFARVALVGGKVQYVSSMGLTRGRVFVLPGMGCAALLARLADSGVSALRPSGIRPTAMRVAETEADDDFAPQTDFVRIRSISAAVSGVAHEINTPLGVIENAASFVSERLGSDLGEALEKTDPDALADITEACKLIQKNVALASRLIRSFKNLSVGQLTEPRERADIVRVINEVLNVFRCKTFSALPPHPNWQAPRGSSGQHKLFLAPSRLKIAVQCSLDAEERTWTGYPGLFSRILLNLLTNVERYAYPGGHEGRVDITVTAIEMRPGRPGFHIEVRDFGAGIQAADLPRIFDPFFTTGRTEGGTGLGLAVVHNLVTQGLDGTIEVDSVVGKGTAFDIRFPATISEHIH